MSDILPLKVMIIDDHFLHRQIVADVMRGFKIGKVDTTGDSSEGRDMIAKAQAFGVPYDVVFLDWNMPVLEGIEILKHFRAQPKFAATAFVMLTAESNQAQVLEAVKAGATAYIVKPVSKETIAKKFTEVLDWVNKKKAAATQKA